VTTLGSEKIIIPAPRAIRVSAADLGPRFIDRAATCVAIEELADRFEYMILLMPEDAVAIGYLGISLFGPLIGNMKMFRQALDVSPVDVDAVITTAIGRAFQTIEQHAQRSAIWAGLISICFAHPAFSSDR
jgi:hypothetical protein